jgi:hypothetical protein
MRRITTILSAVKKRLGSSRRTIVLEGIVDIVESGGTRTKYLFETE